jgi:hypothetical protein
MINHRAMTPEDDLLILCAQQNFNQSHLKSVLQCISNEKLDWDYVFDIASSQGVAPLIYTNLRKCSQESFIIPDNVKSSFEKVYIQNQAFKHEVEESISEILSFLANRSIKVMLLTSTALDTLIYNDQSATFSHDTDLLLGVRRIELSDIEYQEIVEFFSSISSRFKYFTDQFNVNYEYYEFDFFEHHDLTINGMLPINFNEVWKNSWEYKLNGFQVHLMDAEDLLISLCISSARKRFFRLKNMCDINETILKFTEANKGCMSINWDEFIRRAKAYRCNDMIYAALLVVIKCFRLRVPEYVLQNLPSNQFRAGSINSICERKSFSNLSNYSQLYSNSGLFGRTFNRSLLLPYSTYNLKQFLHKFTYVLMNDQRKKMIN